MKSNLKTMVTAIVPAAGNGKRFGINRNKPLYKLKDKPLLIWTLQALQKIRDINEIVPVVKQQDIKKVQKLIELYKITKVKDIVQGGQERQDSIYNALKILNPNTKLVIIHDGARPFIDAKLVQKMISELLILHSSIDGIITGVPIKDTIKEIEGQYLADNIENIFIKKTLNRDLLWAIQTPQIFFFDKISLAYTKAFMDNFYATDDSALVEKYGGRIKVIKGSYLNIKITTPEDIKIVEASL